MSLLLCPSTAIVANSKALFHFLPELIPPIDRQYTGVSSTLSRIDGGTAKGSIEPSSFRVDWKSSSTRFAIPASGSSALRMRLAERPLKAERQRYGVAPPKAIDNAIMNYIKVHGRATGHNRLVGFCGCDALQRRQPPDNPSPRVSPVGRDSGAKPADQAATKNDAVISGGEPETLAKAGEDRNPFADST
jgi:hypothetical protein